MSKPIVTVPNEYAEVNTSDGSYGFNLLPKANKWVWLEGKTEKSRPHITRRSFAEKADILQHVNNKNIDRKKKRYLQRKNRMQKTSK
jgi:hypothetical protein